MIAEINRNDFVLLSYESKVKGYIKPVEIKTRNWEGK